MNVNTIFFKGFKAIKVVLGEKNVQLIYLKKYVFITL